MNPPSGQANGRAQANPAVRHARQTIETARRTVGIIQAILCVYFAATIIGAFINATDRQAFDGSGQASGALKVAQFLSLISLPLLVMAVVLVVSVFASVYIARFEFESRPPDEAPDDSAEISVHLASPVVSPWRAPTELSDMDDVEWRPNGR